LEVAVSQTPKRAGQWLSVSALVCGVVGVCGLADLRDAMPIGKLLLIGPYVGGTTLAIWAGRRRVEAGALAVVGSVVMAGLSWADTLDRQTGGFEWQFNNALSGAVCCGINWLVLAFVASVTLILPARTEHADPTVG
jgi:hypothetical protein